MYLLGYDIGSSSVKAALVDTQTGKTAATDYFPKKEMEITAHRPGWAEQDPASWWENLKSATLSVLRSSGADRGQIAAIGISYQMHGLVLVDSTGEVLRPSIIWCDSRAVPYGERALEGIGNGKCLASMLNSPGNFTASKLAWVKENEPELYSRADKFLLPGDYIAMRLTGRAATTVGGLSEGIFWDFEKNAVSDDILSHFGFDSAIIPDIVPTLGYQGEVTAQAARELGLAQGTPVTYRAGDQPNNALSLNVLDPGEIASTAGTSGVVYGVLGKIGYDPLSRVNTFAHVNHTAADPRLGVLLCINGTGILNSWVKRNFAPEVVLYSELNEIAAESAPGAEGITVIPFGNGAERVIGNIDPGCSFHGINFNIHNRSHILRASQEGIAYSFRYGMEIMKGMGMELGVIRAGNANMFLSPLFREALSCVSGATIELYDTDGAVGAARGAGIGAGIYSSAAEAFASLEKIAVVRPDSGKTQAYIEAYGRWREILKKETEGVNHDNKKLVI
ncbi:MAG: carbohydrate kinase [Rikenellaceae bacterium]|nr:carbohydrate kinase [Rikenellaceae bacterium]